VAAARARGGSVAVWDILEKRAKQKLAGTAAAFAGDGKSLAIAGEHSAAIYETTFWQRTTDLPHPQPVTAVRYVGGELVTRLRRRRRPRVERRDQATPHGTQGSRPHRS
jgi:hypothetical protein